MEAVITFLYTVGDIIIGAIAGEAAVAGVGAITSAVIGATAIIGGTIGLSKLFEVEINVPDTDYSRQRTVKGTTVPIKVVYGEALVSGPIAFVGAGNDAGSSGNDSLFHVVALTGHEVEDITDVYFDNTVISDSDINSGNALGGPVGAGSAIFGPVGGQTITWINKHRGDQTTADTMINNTFQKWTDDHVGEGIAYLATQFYFPDDEDIAEVWNKYTPTDIKALVKGVKTIYDPRSDTSPGANPSSATYQSWSDNPALCLANYLVDTEFGMGVPAAQIDWDSVVDSADYCDASITDPSGTVTRYTCNGVLFGTETHANNVSKLLSSMNGSLVYTNGVYVMNAGERLSPTVSLTEDDLSGHVTITTASKRSERFNTITGIFNDPAQNHKQVEFPKVTIANVKNNRDNGEELTKQIQLSFTNDVYMAQRLAYQMVNRSNNQMVMDFPTNLRGLKVAVGDRVQITLNAIAGPDGDTISFVNKVFMCTNFSFTDSSSGAVNLTLVEDYDGVNDYYADMPSNAYSTVNLADGTITDGFSGLQSPSGITATGVDQGIALDWTNPPSMPAGARVKIEEDDSVSSTYAGANIIRVYYTSGDFYNIFDIPANTTRQYWLSIIRGSDASPVAGPYSATSGEVLADSIDWLDVDNKLLALDLTGDTLSISATTTGTVTGNDIAESGIKQTIEIDSGGVIMNAGGVIKSLNKDTESDTDAGFFLGWNAAANSGSGSYTFGVGDGTDYLKYIDGTLTVSGTLSGVDGDFSGTIEIGSGNSIFKADGNGIYLGNATFASAPFSVTPDGEISSTSGTIGGFTLGSTSLSAGSGATTVSMSTADGIHLGATAFASAPFSVTPAGALTATDAQITGEINATSGDFSGQIAVGSTAGAITVIDGNNSDYRIFTNATLDTDTNQYLPDDSAFRVGNDGRVFASNITIYDNQGQVLLSPTGLGAAALNNISNTSGSVVSTVGGELANSTSEITLTTSSASESFEISSKVAIDDNYDATQYTAGYSSVGVVDAESQLTSIQLIVDYYVRTDGGSYTSPAVSQTVSFTTSQSPTSSQITVNGYDRGSGYAGSLTRYFAVLQTYGGAMEALPNSGGGSTKYLLTSATLGSSNFPNAGTYKIKIVVRGVVSGTSTELTGSTTPPLSDGTTTGVGFDGANSDERIYDITGTGLIQTGTNTFVSGAQNLLSSGGVIDGNLTVSGTLTVNGGTTTINSTVVTVDDPIFTVGGDTAPTSDDGKDRGIAFRWHQNPGTAQEGFFGFDRSTEKFTFIKFGTNSSEVFSGTRGDTDFRDVGGESLTLTKDTNFLTKFNEGNNYDATITIGSAGNFIVNRYSSSTTTEIFNLRSTGDLDIGGILTTGADGNSGDWYSAFTFVDALTASATELNYVDGVTSAIQTQLDAKAATTSLANYLPLAGGTLTGRLSTDIGSDYWATTIAGANDAPLYVPAVNVGTTDRFIPVFGTAAQYTDGYVTHLNVGLFKKASGGWSAENGMYIGLGGNDSNPTEYFKFHYGGQISHSNGVYVAQEYKEQPVGNGDHKMHTWNKIHATMSDNYGLNSYLILDTSVPQDSFSMAGFDLVFMTAYDSTANSVEGGGDIIHIYGYWNQESNSGFTGFRYICNNPDFSPTIQVARKVSDGNVSFILSGFGTTSYAQLIAKNLYSGYTSSGADSSWGDGWAFSTTADYGTAYTNIDTVQRISPSVIQGDLSVGGDIKMVGTDSFIWSPNTQDGYTGFYDIYNTSIAAQYKNSSGGAWGFGGEPDATYKLKVHGSINTTSNLYVNNTAYITQNLSVDGYASLENGKFQTSSTSNTPSGGNVELYLFPDNNNTHIWRLISGGSNTGYGTGAGGLGFYYNSNSSYNLILKPDMTSVFGNKVTISHTNLSAEPYSGLEITNTSTTGLGFTGITSDAKFQTHYRYKLNGALKWQTRVGAGNGTDDFRIYSWTAARDIATFVPTGYGYLSLFSNGQAHDQWTDASGNGSISINGFNAFGNNSNPNIAFSSNNGGYSMFYLNRLTADAAVTGSNNRYFDFFLGGTSKVRQIITSGDAFGFYMNAGGTFNIWNSDATQTFEVSNGGQVTVPNGQFEVSSGNALLKKSVYIGEDGGYLQLYDSNGIGSTTTRGAQYYEAASTEFRFYGERISDGAAIGIAPLQRYTGSAYKNIFDEGTGVPFSSIGTGSLGGTTRTNYQLTFKPASGDYAGLTFTKQDGDPAGYLLIRSNADAAPTYKADGITLVGDGGWLSLVQRTTGNTGIRLLTGATPEERITISSTGLIDAPSAVWNRTYHQLFDDANASGFEFDVRTHWGVLCAGSNSEAPSTYTIIETNIDQDSYRMGGFTILVMDNYGDSGGNAGGAARTRARIDLAGYWNAESNGGFIGWNYTTTNPRERPTIYIMRNSTTGKTAFAYQHSPVTTASYPIVLACDLWLGYNGANEADGKNWTIKQAADLSGYTNSDQVNYVGGNGNYQDHEGKFVVSKASGTILSHGSFADAIGYNASYGTYIGGDSRFVYSGGAGTGNGGTHPYYYNGTSSYNITHDAGQIANTYNGSHSVTSTNFNVVSSANAPTFTTTTTGSFQPLLLANVNNTNAHGLVVNQTNASYWAAAISTQGWGLYVDSHASVADKYLYRADIAGNRYFSINSDGNFYARGTAYFGAASTSFGALHLWDGPSDGGTIDMFSPNGSHCHTDIRDLSNHSVPHKYTYSPTYSYGTYQENWYDGPSSSYYSIKVSGGSFRINTSFVASSNITAYGSFSDKRLKENIRPFENARELIKGIDVHRFNYIGKDDDLIGVIAQEVEQTLPQLVYEVIDEESDEPRKAVRYDHLSAVLLKVVKEQENEIQELKELIKQVMEKIK